MHTLRASLGDVRVRLPLWSAALLLWLPLSTANPQETRVEVPVAVDLLSVPSERGLRCYPPSTRETATVRLVFQTNSHPTESRQLHLELGPEGALSSVGDIQWGQDAAGRTIMYTATATWRAGSGSGLLVELHMRNVSDSDSVRVAPRQRVLSESELAKAKRLGAWLIGQRCDTLPRGQ